MEGRVSITREGWQLSTLGPGVTLGEMTYLQPEHKIRSATAVAETDVLVLKVRNPSLMEASADLQSRFDKAFIKVLVSRLVATSKQLGAWELSAPQD
nr:cyclic nucleotide-binding domain-containing protein [Acidovorax sp. 1608163]